MRKLTIDASDAAPGEVKGFIRKSPGLVDFNVEAIENVSLAGPDDLMAREFMSPFVWAESDGRFDIMVRPVDAVPGRDALADPLAHHHVAVVAPQRSRGRIARLVRHKRFENLAPDGRIVAEAWPFVLAGLPRATVR